MPESDPCMGFARGSQPFQSPMTDTDCAFGAHTAKCVAESRPASRKCAPSFSYRRACVPSRKRYWSCPVMTMDGRSVTAGMGVRYLKWDRQLLPWGHINFDHADRLRSALHVREPGHSRTPRLSDRRMA